MIKVILMIDCNICGQPFEKIETSTQNDTMDWKSRSVDLEYISQDSGWSFFRSAHYCGDCVSDAAYSQLAENSAASPFRIHSRRWSR